MIQAITVPDIGEKVESGKVVGVLVSVDDMVEKDDGIIEFETEKAVVEIPSPAAGRIVEILVKEGDELKIGDTIARLETGTDTSEKGAPVAGKSTEDVQPQKDTTDEQPDISEDQVPAPKPSAPKEPTQKETPSTPQDEEKIMPVPAAPSVRRFARELGVDIQAVNGSGPGGRISEQDVKDFVKGALTSRKPFSTETDTPALPDFSQWGDIETVDMTTVRRITADSMSASWRTVPHVTQFDSADISHLDQWMAQVSGKVKQTGSRLTITAVIMKVVAKGLRKFPYFNASMDRENEQIILKDYVHIGMAVDTQRGLLVPVVRNADRKSIRDLADEIADLADRARNKRLKPDEMEGGTFTLSNQGGIGGTNFTPIVYWPQAAILGVSRTAIEPRYIDETWQPRSILPMSLSYDHRINDGAQAARFLRWVCDALEYPMTLYS